MLSVTVTGMFAVNEETLTKMIESVFFNICEYLNLLENGFHKSQSNGNAWKWVWYAQNLSKSSFKMVLKACLQAKDLFRFRFVDISFQPLYFSVLLSLLIFRRLFSFSFFFLLSARWNAIIVIIMIIIHVNFSLCTA